MPAITPETPRSEVTKVLLIPVYNCPEGFLEDIIDGYLKLSSRAVVLVDDGSDSRCGHYLKRVARRPSVHLVEHAVNLGKGAALKSGLNFILLTFPKLESAVLADADGQHRFEDILKLDLYPSPECDLILGVRSFTGKVPIRSSIGNRVTRLIFLLATFYHLRDTQTGLRRLSPPVARHCLKITQNGYEFEMEMLLRAIREQRRIHQVGIRTIYHEGNRHSHFQPLRDSLRILSVLIRFSLSSLLTALIDYAVFVALTVKGCSLQAALAVARIFAGSFNFAANRSLVFQAEGNIAVQAIQYASFVVLLSGFSYFLIKAAVASLGVSLLVAKVFAEALLFFTSFGIQRYIVFRRTEPEAAREPLPVLAGPGKAG